MNPATRPARFSRFGFNRLAIIGSLASATPKRTKIAAMAHSLARVAPSSTLIATPNPNPGRMLTKTPSATIYFVIMRQNLSLPGLKKLYDNPQQWVEAVGEKADLYQLKLQLSKKDGDWQVKTAYLKPFKGFGF